jgi:hypothetical protein
VNTVVPENEDDFWTTPLRFLFDHADDDDAPP